MPEGRKMEGKNIWETKCARKEKRRKKKHKSIEEQLDGAMQK